MELINYTKRFRVWSTSVTNYCSLLRTFMVSLKKINYLAAPLRREYRPWLKIHCWVHCLLALFSQSHITGCTWKGPHSCQDEGYVKVIKWLSEGRSPPSIFFPFYMNSNWTTDLYLIGFSLWGPLSWQILVEMYDLVDWRMKQRKREWTIWHKHSCGIYCIYLSTLMLN